MYISGKFKYQLSLNTCPDVEPEYAVVDLYFSIKTVHGRSKNTSIIIVLTYFQQDLLIISVTDQFQIYLQSLVRFYNV